MIEIHGTYKQLQVDSIRLYSQLIVLVSTRQTDGLTWAIEQLGQTIFRTFQSDINSKLTYDNTDIV